MNIHINDLPAYLRGFRDAVEHCQNLVEKEIGKDALLNALAEHDAALERRAALKDDGYGGTV